MTLSNTYSDALSQALQNAASALRVSVESIIDDESIDVREQQIQIEETFGQYHERVGLLIAQAADAQRARPADPGTPTPPAHTAAASKAWRHDMVAVAKRVLAGETTPFTKRDFFLAIEERAALYRAEHPTVTKEAAWTEVATKTPEGRALFAAHRSLPGSDCEDTCDLWDILQGSRGEGRGAAEAATEAHERAGVHQDPNRSRKPGVSSGRAR